MKTKLIALLALTLFATATMAEIVIINTPGGSTKCIVLEGVVTCL